MKRGAMRAEYDFSTATRNPHARRLLRAGARRLPGERNAGDLPPLTKTQLRELDRRMRDMDNPVRYVIESRILPRHSFRLFYNLSDDMWATDISDATLFKRRRTALAVKVLLSYRTRVVRLALPTRPGSGGPGAGRRAPAARSRRYQGP